MLQAFVSDELPDLLGEATPEQNPSTMIAENLPCPRLTGAVFSPRGMASLTWLSNSHVTKGRLLLFSNFAKKLPIVVRTMEDYLSHDKGELGSTQSPFFSIPDIFYGQGWGVDDNAQIKMLRKNNNRSAMRQEEVRNAILLRCDSTDPASSRSACRRRMTMASMNSRRR